MLGPQVNMEKIALQLNNISKTYNNGICANKNINLTVKEGSIHAIAGENGAGKSTLMKIIYGIEQPDAGGEIIVYDKKINFKSPKDAIAKNIGMVHQHFMLFDSMTVSENILINSKFSKYGIVNPKQMAKITKELCEKYHFYLDPNEKVSNLPVARQQQLEILKALWRGARILILDEPTSTLTPQEQIKLFEELQLLKQEGHTILFISHKLNEILKISDTISIIRGGKITATVDTKDCSVAQLSNLIVGREFVEKIDRKKITHGQKLLEVNDLHYASKAKVKILNGLNLELNEGEILGIAGVDGNGQNEFTDIITRQIKRYNGSVKFIDSEVYDYDIAQMRQKGLAYIHQDRLKYALSKTSSIKENLISNLYINKKFVKKHIFLDKTQIDECAKNAINDFAIKAESGDDIVNMLSGGNMQKVVCAREFANNPKLIIADQPTRGVDIGASKLIRENLVALRDKKCGVLLISADLSEILSISDRIAVMYNGRLTALFDNSPDLSEEQLGLYMLGIEDMFINTHKIDEQLK